MKRVAVLASCASSGKAEFRRPVGILTNVANLFGKLHKGWHRLMRNKEVLHHTTPKPLPMCHPSIKTSEVLMPQITLYLLPARWARRSGVGFSKTFLHTPVYLQSVCAVKNTPP